MQLTTNIVCVCVFLASLVLCVLFHFIIYKTNKQTNNKQTNKQTNKQANKQTSKQTNNQTDKTSKLP